MNSKNITLSKSTVNKQKGVVVLPLEKWQKMEKERIELNSAIEAILAGEFELKEGKLRTFKEFLASHHAKN